MNNQKFTDKELANWKKYEKVRLGGRWNMFESAARRATGLSQEEYVFTMHHFTALRGAVKKQSKI